MKKGELLQATSYKELGNVIKDTAVSCMPRDRKQLLENGVFVAIGTGLSMIVDSWTPLANMVCLAAFSNHEKNSKQNNMEDVYKSVLADLQTVLAGKKEEKEVPVSPVVE